MCVHRHFGSSCLACLLLRPGSLDCMALVAPGQDRFLEQPLSRPDPGREPASWGCAALVAAYLAGLATVPLVRAVWQVLLWILLGLRSTLSACHRFSCSVCSLVWSSSASAGFSTPARKARASSRSPLWSEGPLLEYQSLRRTLAPRSRSSNDGRSD